jgi:hypothetical protein
MESLILAATDFNLQFPIISQFTGLALMRCPQLAKRVE